MEILRFIGQYGGRVLVTILLLIVITQCIAHIIWALKPSEKELKLLKKEVSSELDKISIYVSDINTEGNQDDSKKQAIALKEIQSLKIKVENMNIQ